MSETALQEQTFVDIRLYQGPIFSLLVGVYDSKEQAVHLLDNLTCSGENETTIALLCQSALQRGQSVIVIDSRFVREKGEF